MAWLWCTKCGEKFLNKAMEDEELYVQNQEWSLFTHGTLREAIICDSCNRTLESGSKAFLCTTHRSSMSTPHRAREHFTSEKREVFTVGRPSSMNPVTSAGNADEEG